MFYCSWLGFEVFLDTTTSNRRRHTGLWEITFTFKQTLGVMEYMYRDYIVRI